MSARRLTASIGSGSQLHRTINSAASQGRQRVVPGGSSFPDGPSWQDNGELPFLCLVGRLVQPALELWVGRADVCAVARSRYCRLDGCREVPGEEVAVAGGACVAACMRFRNPAGGRIHIARAFAGAGSHIAAIHQRDRLDACVGTQRGQRQRERAGQPATEGSPTALSRMEVDGCQLSDERLDGELRVALVIPSVSPHSRCRRILRGQLTVALPERSRSRTTFWLTGISNTCAISASVPPPPAMPCYVMPVCCLT